MRYADKGSREVIEQEIRRRHTKAFGDIDKPIGMMINDLMLYKIEHKLRPISKDLYERGMDYGLAMILNPDAVGENPPSACWHLMGGRGRAEYTYEYIRRYVDDLITYFPDHADNILTGYYKFLAMERADYVAAQLADQHRADFYDTALESDEGQFYIGRPHNIKLWQQLKKNCRIPNEVLVKIKELTAAPGGRSYLEVLDTYGIEALVDLDGRSRIRSLMARENHLNEEDKSTLQKYYEYRCQQEGLNPETHWLKDNKKFIKQAVNQLLSKFESNAKEPMSLQYRDRHWTRLPGRYGSRRRSYYKDYLKKFIAYHMEQLRLQENPAEDEQQFIEYHMEQLRQQDNPGENE